MVVSEILDCTTKLCFWHSNLNKMCSNYVVKKSATVKEKNCGSWKPEEKLQSLQLLCWNDNNKPTVRTGKSRKESL